MADEGKFLSYDQVLQELKINRSQLNLFIRGGRLHEHVVGGETMFSLPEIVELKRELEKEPTVMEELGPEPEAPAPAEVQKSKEPETVILEEDEDEITARRETDVVEHPATPAGERETVMMEEGQEEVEARGADEFGLEALEEELSG